MENSKDKDISLDQEFWSGIENRLKILDQELNSPNLESIKRSSLQKEHSSLKVLLTKYQEIKDLKTEIANIAHQGQLLRAQDNQQDKDLLELYQQELSYLEGKLNKENIDLDNLLYPADEIDNKSIFLEIRAGAGGQEASLFASDLLAMYTRYAIKKNWRVSIANISETDLGGYKEVIISIDGKGVYGHLRYESGVHRVQRVPSTETSGRVHTSTATVAVLPEFDEIDFEINPQDLKIDTYRAGGAGGQHVNKTDSAVRITHIPTGVVVACQDERSQHKNKAKAMKLLQSRLLTSEKEKQESQISQKRKELVGTGMRSEKVRTYNFPQNRVTDHQVDLTLNKLDIVLLGNLDEIIDALIAKANKERRKKKLIINNK